MPTTNHTIVFGRMRADARRLQHVAPSQALREKLTELIAVYDVLEARFNSQQTNITPSKPFKRRTLAERREYNRELQFCADQGRDAFYGKLTKEDCPYSPGPKRDRWIGSWENAEYLQGNSPELPNSEEDQA